MLGKDNPEQAKRFAICCVVVAVSLVSTLAMILNIFPYQIAGMFTKDAATIALIVDTLPVLSIFVILDAVHGVNAGNVRALGRQKVVSVSTLLCYYAMGLPLALIFGFQMEMNLIGFWLGYLLAMGLLDIIVCYLVATADWVAKFKGAVSEVLKQPETDLEDSKTEIPVDQLKAKLLQISPELEKTK
jgi:MATE family multidrug resistance protein